MSDIKAHLDNGFRDVGLSLRNWKLAWLLHAMQETQVQSLGWEDLLEKRSVTHCSILSSRIP